jgi:Holliday junction resolvase
MSKWSKTTRDKSHLSIQKELRQRGFGVIDLAGVGDDVPDLFVASRTTACLAELKESLDSLITIAQIEFIAQWKHNVVIALSVSDIIEAMESESFLSPAEKDKMLQIVVRQRATSTDTNPRITVKRLRKLLYET